MNDRIAKEPNINFYLMMAVSGHHMHY